MSRLRYIRAVRPFGPCLLQGSYKALELCLGVGLVLEEEARQDEVECAPVSRVRRVLHEGKILQGMILEDVVGGIQFQKQLPAHISTG